MSRPEPRRWLWAVVALVGLKLIARAVTLAITPYEVHRDEFL